VIARGNDAGRLPAGAGVALPAGGPGRRRIGDMGWFTAIAKPPGVGLGGLATLTSRKPAAG